MNKVVALRLKSCNYQLTYPEWRHTMLVVVGEYLFQVASLKDLFEQAYVTPPIYICHLTFLTTEVIDSGTKIGNKSQICYRNIEKMQKMVDFKKNKPIYRIFLPERRKKEEAYLNGKPLP